MYRGGGTMVNDTPILVEDFNDEFSNIMDEMYDFYIFGRDYYLSLREQFTADLVKDYVNNEQVIMEGTFTNAIKKIIDGIIRFIKTMWRKFIGLFIKSSKNVIEKVDNVDKKPLIPDELKKAVDDKDVDMCRILISDVMLTGVLWHNDIKFKQSDAMLEYVKRKLPSVMEQYDGRELNMNKSDWDKHLLDTDRVSLVTNFSQERYDYHKKVILYVTSKPNWAKEKSKKTITGYNYLKIIQGKYWKDTINMCNDMYSLTIRKSKDIDMSIRRILTKWNVVHPNIGKSDLNNFFPEYEDPEKMSKVEGNNYKNPYAQILFVLGADELNDISKTDIRDYIFRGEQQESLSIDKKYTSDTINIFKSEITNIEKNVKTHEKDLKDLISVLEKMKSNIEKDAKSLDQYKQDVNDKKYYDSDEKMQKIIINFLKSVQTHVNECITFEAKVVQTQISIINEGIAFIKSNS